MANMSKPVSLNSPMQTFANATFTVPGSQAKSAIINCTIYPYGYSQASTASFTIPSNETWNLLELYVDATLDVDAQPIFYVNGQTQPFSINLNATVSSNSARVPVLTPIAFDPGVVVQIAVVTTQANSSTSDVNEAFNLLFVRVPV